MTRIIVVLALLFVSSAYVSAQDAGVGKVKQARTVKSEAPDKAKPRRFVLAPNPKIVVGPSYGLYGYLG